MSYTQLSRKVVKVRKDRVCELCAKVTKKHEPMVSISYVYDGDIGRNHTCLICDEFMTYDKWREVDNEMDYGGIWNYFEEYKAFRENKLKNVE